jgi:hypothetical protein
VANHRKYYKGEGNDFPSSLGHGESCEFVYAHGSSMHQKCSNYALTNLLFGFWRFVSIVDQLVTLPSPHPKTPTHPSYPNYLFFHYFHLRIRIWVFQKVWGCINGVLIDHILRWHVIEHSSWMLPHFAYLRTKLFTMKTFISKPFWMIWWQTHLPPSSVPRPTHALNHLNYYFLSSLIPSCCISSF